MKNNVIFVETEKGVNVYSKTTLCVFRRRIRDIPLGYTGIIKYSPEDREYNFIFSFNTFSFSGKTMKLVSDKIRELEKKNPKLVDND